MDKHSQQIWLCRCECGNEKEILLISLKTGNTKSCGCSTQELRTKGITKHGHNQTGKRSPTYISWDNMIGRCNRPSQLRYKHYGGRGITYDVRWKSFANFLEDMGERPKGKTLDRIDVDGNYCKENCRWATNKEQNNNKQKTQNRQKHLLSVNF